MPQGSQNERLRQDAWPTIDAVRARCHTMMRYRMSLVPYARNAESSEGELFIVVRGFQNDIAILDRNFIEESTEIGC
jgi:hypothetical protein